MAKNKHGFEPGDIIKGAVGVTFHLLILEALPEPYMYKALVMETGALIKRGHYTKSYFKKVSQ